MDEEGGQARAEQLRQTAIAWLARLQSGAGAEGEEAFLAWYAADPEHAATFDAVQDSWDRMALSRFTSAAGRGRDEGAGQMDTPVFLLAASKPYLAAGITLILALLLVLAGLSWHRHIDITPFQGEGPELASRLGEIRTIALPDRSRVTLDTSTDIEVQFSKQERRILLRHGRARFEVSHDPTRLFVVQAGRHEVIAHGTIFDVELRGERQSVWLLRGSVEVRPDVGAIRAPSKTGRMLAPGQRLVIPVQGDLPLPTHEAPGDQGWASGMLTFAKAPIGEIIDAANLYNVRHILLADPQLRGLRITVTAKASDIDGLAQTIAAVEQLALSRDAQGNFVLSAQVPQK